MDWRTDIYDAELLWTEAFECIFLKSSPSAPGRTKFDGGFSRFCSSYMSWLTFRRTRSEFA